MNWKNWISVAGAGVILMMSSCSTAPEAAPVTAPAPRPTFSDASAGSGETRALKSRPAPSKWAGTESREVRQRPGLATGWGRELRSESQYREFHRASGKPYGGISVLRYNDREGAEAMGASMGGRGQTTHSAASGLVEWGVTSGWRKLRSYWSRKGRVIVGRKRHRYRLYVKNLARRRVEAVFSVDGLDVIDGRPASVRKRGYLVQPGQTLEVKGFRKREDAVAAFEFSGVSDSYAELRHGDTRNVGVIGLAVFTEKGVDPWGRDFADLKKRGRARAFAEEPAFRAR